MAIPETRRGWQTREPNTEQTLEAFASERRRTILSVLDRLSAVTAEELATHVLAAESEKSLTAVSETEVQEVETTLHHQNLPKLEAAGLITCSGGTVSLARYSPCSVWEFISTFETNVHDWDSVFSTFASERYRVVASTLDSGVVPMDRRGLAEAITEHEYGEDHTAHVDELERELHHVVLPKLEALDLLVYDVETERVYPSELLESVTRLVSCLSR